MADSSKASRIGRPRIDAENEPATVCLSLPAREYDAFYQQAQRAGVTVPEAIRRALRRSSREDDPEA